VCFATRIRAAERIGLEKGERIPCDEVKLNLRLSEPRLIGGDAWHELTFTSLVDRVCNGIHLAI
jgi:hypothetical protein